MSGRSMLVRRVVAPAALLAVALASGGPVQAQDDVADLREERESTRREAADAAAELDALSIEDQQLVLALADLDAHIELQESKVRAAEVRIDAAEARAVDALAEAEALVVEMDAIRLRLRDRAVDAFVGTGREEAEQLNNSDLMGQTVRRYLLDEVVDDEIDVVDELRSAEARRLEVERIAIEAAAQADAERSDLRDRLADLEVVRVDAEELRVEVAGRIAEWEATAAVIEQADADITTEIRRLEAEAAARQAAADEEARRLEEETRQLEEQGSEEEPVDPESADPESADPDSVDDADVDGETDAIDDDQADDEPDPAVPPPADGSFGVTHRPVPGGWSSGFGPRVHPIFGTTRMHYGIDFHAGSGEPISAAASGTVLTAGWMNGYGNTVVVSHGNGNSTLYAHQSSIAVASGDTVSGGDVVGHVGSTGWSTGPHLHFEVRVDGTAVDPAPYMP